MRVVIDVRALQEPSRAPLTAAYLEGLLGAFDADPRPGESFAFLLASDEDDPTTAYRHLEVVGRRLLPPTRLLRSTALTVDPFMLRGASVGAAWRAERGGAHGAVYHAVGGALPIASGVPVVATLLDLAPWELPETFQRTRATRFGQRLRGRLLRRAAAVLVGSDAVARSARRLVRIRRDRLRVVPLAARPWFADQPPNTPGGTAGGAPGAAAGDRSATHYGLGARYFLYTGRYDARHDLDALARALAILARTDRPSGLSAGIDWPPRVLLVDARPDDRAAVARVLARHGAAEQVAYAPTLSRDATAALVRRARAVLVPARSDAAGLSAIEAIAAGVPVIASAVGALPEVVGTAGILVEPGDPARLAAAMTAGWDDGAAYDRIADAVRSSSTAGGGTVRTWADVALEVRAIYAEVSAPGRW
ncbi:MAG TPA: glycosyltransferase [Candidatus Limnocylindrales bacterium]|nr:glycosyltransferase [Candidatus Limnocylindrales bacterium]